MGGSILNIKISLHFVLLLFTFQHAVAQDQQISFKHLSTVDGLSNFTVFSIEQDNRGFMWFGTMDGLNRFDGKQIRTYRLNKDNPYSLGNNMVHTLLCTSDSGMWVGTGLGLYYYDFFHDDFHSIPIVTTVGDSIEDVEIKTLVQDQNIIWIGTSHGLFKYDLINEHLVNDWNKGENNTITTTIEVIHITNDGRVWIGGEQGLLTFQNENLVRIENDESLKYNDETNVISINSDSKGRIWFGTLDRETGLMIYDPENGNFIDLNAQDGYLPHNKVNCLYTFRDGKVWAGTTWGLSIIDQDDFTSQKLLYERQNPRSISHNSIRDIYQGKDGIIWIGTYSGGVNYFDTRSQLIRHETNIYQNRFSLSFNIVSSIFEDNNKDLWIGTEYGGLNILNHSDKSYRVLRRNENPNSLKSDNVKSTIQDNAGRIFIATQFGLSIYDPQDNSFFNIDDNLSTRGRLNFSGLMDFCKDNLGNIWIATHKWIGISKLPGPGYLLMYDIEKDSIIHYLPKNNELPIVEGGVNSLVYDPARDFIWCGGDNGLTGFNSKSKKYLNDEKFLKTAGSIKGTVINDLFLDGNGLLWLATFGDGLWVMDINSYQLRKISADEGISENSFYALTVDDDGNIWASVSAYLLKIGGLNNIDGKVRLVEKYGIQEGFPPQQYFRKAACKGSDGTLYFGGDDGYIEFNPKEVKNRVFYPSVTILDISINGESLELMSKKKDQFLNVASLKRVSLTHAQSSFAVQFIAPNFINPDNTWYQYQLSGIHDTWQDLGNANTINFTELNAGEYELKLRASSDPENFMDEYNSILLNVAPPFWGTPLAYLIYLILILVLLYIFFIISRKWERLNQNLRFEHLKREQENEFNQRQIKFFTDISHELRTPLTLILAPLETIIKTNIGNVKLRNQLMLMLRNGDRMLQLINQLLDLRKLETGHMRLKVAKGNIVRFVKETSLSFRELANDRNIDFKVDSDQEVIDLWFDRDKFEIIFFNLLSNAVKYTPDQGRITISLRHDNRIDSYEEERSVILCIENSGYGIPEDQIDHIFERFFSGEKKDELDRPSTGVGLEIVKNLVNLHHGEISAKSIYDEQGQDGLTSFTISLKKGKNHFDKTQIISDYKSSEDIANYVRSGDLIPEETLKDNVTEPEGTSQEDKEESVLIIEDNTEVRKLVVSVFSDQYNTFEASNGEEGLSIAQEKIPDLIVSDIMMPLMDGI